VSEEDEQWQALYHMLNESAKATTVERFQSAKNEFTVAWFLMKAISAPSKSIRMEVKDLPEKQRDVWIDWLKVLIDTMNGSAVVRLGIRLGASFGLVHRMFRTYDPVASRHMTKLQEAATDWGLCNSHSAA
jgi:hypothetical protein